MSKRELPVENIPECLRKLPQWICWKSGHNGDGKVRKIPIQPTMGWNASTTDSKTWTTFDVALKSFYRNWSLAGIAFVFCENDPYVGIDIDDCLGPDGEFVWGKDIVESLATYAEVSPSGRGVKLILRGTKPEWANCRADGFGPDGLGKVEVYDHARCFCITGQRLPDSPVGVLDRQTELDALCAKLWPHEAEQTPVEPAILSFPQTSLDQRQRDCLDSILAMRIVDHADGSHRLFSACCRCVEFDLNDTDSIGVIRQYERQCPFPQTWTDAAIVKRLRSAERKAKRGEAKQQPPKLSPSLLNVGQLLHEFPELRTPVIHGLLRSGETMNVIAPPKYGKSWLVTDLALAVATGRQWLDVFQTEQGNVLILDNELHPETSANRIPKVAKARDIPLEEIADRLFIDNLRGRLQDVNSLQGYFESLKAGFFKIIVMDAFYRFLPKDSDENSNANMTDVYNRLDWYAAMLGCSFVLVHHASKGNQSGKSITDVGAGAGSQARATDTHLILRQHEENECVVVDAAVRSWHPLEPRCLRWSFPVWNIDDSLDPADLRPERPRKRAKPKAEEKPAKPEWTPDRFADKFVSDEPTTIKSIIAAAKRAGVSQRLAKELLQLAEDGNLIHRWSFGANRPVKFATQSQLGSEPI